MPKRAVEPTYFPFFDYTHYSFSLGVDTRAGVWLSGHTASRYSSAHHHIVIEDAGDIVAQARVAHEKIAAIVQAAGLGRHDVVRLVDYVTVDGMAEYPRLAELRQERFGARLPVVSTVVVHRLLRPTALIEIEAVAAPGGGMPIGAAPASGAGVLGRRMGDVVYFSAQLPLQPHRRSDGAG